MGPLRRDGPVGRDDRPDPEGVRGEPAAVDLRAVRRRRERDGEGEREEPAIALFRRLVGFVPFIGDFADWLPIPYHFEFKRGEQIIGTHSRQAFKFADTYTIDFTGDPGRKLDRRLVLATAVGLDALQAR